MKICQRLCQCQRTHRDGYTNSARFGMWVHSKCGLPVEMYYVEGAKRGNVPVPKEENWGWAGLLASSSTTGSARAR